MSERSEASTRMSMPTPTWYDLLGVEPSADEETIRGAWRAAIADLDPTERRFATFNEAAAVLLDPARRSAYDAEIAPTPEPEVSRLAALAPQPPEAAALAPQPPEAAGLAPQPPEAAGLAPQPPEAAGLAPQPPEAAGLAPQPPGKEPYLVPAWVLATVGVVAAAAVILAAVLATRSGPEKVVQDTAQLVSGSKVTDIEQPAIAALAAAKEAAVPVVTYDYRSLDAGQRAAESHLTDSYRATYDKIFEKLRSPIASTRTVITAKVLEAGIVRAGGDRVQVLVLIDRSTTRKGSTTPTLTQDQVTLTMAKSGGAWLVDDMSTNQIPE